MQRCAMHNTKDIFPVHAPRKGENIPSADVVSRQILEGMADKIRLMANEKGATQLALESVLNSRSWKCTARLRDFVAMSRRWKSMIRRAFRKSDQGTFLTSAFNHSLCWDARGEEYASWIEKHETLSAIEHEKGRKLSEELQVKPLFSVVMPTYNTDEKWLRRAIESVRQQVYEHWEMCIADDASTAPHVKKVLEEFALIDNRIKVVFRSVNGHISEASNTALDMAKGDYCVLLDHDDEIPPYALFIVAKAINEKPDADVFFSDEDKILEDGTRIDPYFKFGFNRDLLLSQNCISHLGVYRTSVLREVGGFRKGFEGSQDWDLALRVIDKAGFEKVHHIPHILYHWRIIKTSTASGTQAKPYVVESQCKAVKEHLDRNSAGDTEVEYHWAYSQLRVRFPLPVEEPLVSIIIPTRDRVDLLRRCIDSIVGLTTYRHFELIIVDHESERKESYEYFRYLETFPGVKILKAKGPFNYSRLNNMAVAEARGSYLAFLNNDLEAISPSWLGEMLSHACRPGIGAVGARLWYPDNRLQHGGLLLGLGGIANSANWRTGCGAPGYFSTAVVQINFSAVTAACMVLKRELFEKVGGFDEDKLSIAFNDVDLCLKLQKAGYRNVFTPYADLYHYESASRGYDSSMEKIARLKRESEIMNERWQPVIENDPYFNQNLSRKGPGVALAFPPKITVRSFFS